MIRIKTIFCIVVLSCIALSGWAQSSAQLKKQREALTREIELLNNTLRSTSKDKSLSLKQVNALNAQINLRVKKISTINTEMTLIEKQINKNTNTIRSLQAELAKLKKGYASMVQFAFRNQSAYNKLMFLFASNDFNQAYKRLKYLQQFSDSRKKQAQEIENTQKSIEQKIAELATNRKEKVALLTDQEKEKKTLDGQKTVKSRALNDLTQKEKEYKQELNKKQQEDARLARAIQAAIRREIEEARRIAEEEARRRAAEEAKKNPNAKAPEKTAKTSDKEALLSTPEAAKLAADFTGNRGKLPWPVASGSITQGYGQYTYGKGVKVSSNGLTIRTAAGAPVRAVFDGVVSTVFQMQNQYAVIIRHGNYFTVYQNLKSVSVSKNQKVTVKQAIGAVAVDPTEGTSDLHFEIWQGTSPINPSSWLAGN
ncbi:murein hydrolase activator EnvC family protein [Olivibacter domesticus]|uniref:Septal ring factor EnvC, activator of murein hydrolases AmiA and AmiB n=1 Tax=Olivibacter domesticus TaxID=407022 RepID=A0A1H7SM31_OLID1|nr:peptidoglycan DD-metalloendopeptidase family protein [Olivibacter domesticus]SEL73528.1 Septal ring factor EnvC, activator of murein hydrolases AmiA and AmiB [Olivibacter domesticus]